MGPGLLVEYGQPHALLRAVVLQAAPGAAGVRAVADVAAVVRPGERHRLILLHHTLHDAVRFSLLLL